MQSSQLLAKVSPLIDASALQDEEKAQLKSKLKEVSTPLQTDPWIYRLVVGFLGTTILITMVGGVFLNQASTELPSGIIAIGSAAVGALAGLLAPSPTGR
jgi:hypothetical protein